MKDHLPTTIKQPPHRTSQGMDRLFAWRTVTDDAVGCENCPRPKGQRFEVGK